MSRGFSIVTIVVVLIFTALSFAALLLLNELVNGSSLSTPISLKENLVGRWGCTGAGAHSIEFDAKGYYTTTGTRGSVKGIYQIKTDNMIELDAPEDQSGPALWEVQIKINPLGIRILEGPGRYDILWNHDDLAKRNSNFPTCRVIYSDTLGILASTSSLFTRLKAKRL